jgi:hypothetical protein
VNLTPTVKLATTFGLYEHIWKKMSAGNKEFTYQKHGRMLGVVLGNDTIHWQQGTRPVIIVIDGWCRSSLDSGAA